GKHLVGQFADPDLVDNSRHNRPSRQLPPQQVRALAPPRSLWWMPVVGTSSSNLTLGPVLIISGLLPESKYIAGSACGGPSSFLGPYLRDRKSTRLNSSHLVISYAVFCL